MKPMLFYWISDASLVCKSRRNFRVRTPIRRSYVWQHVATNLVFLWISCHQALPASTWTPGTAESLRFSAHCSKGAHATNCRSSPKQKNLRPGLQGKISTSSSWPQPRSRTQPCPTAAPGLVTKDTTDFTKERPVLPLGGWEGPWRPWEANGWKRSPASWCLTSLDNPNRFLAWNPLLSPHMNPLLQHLVLGRIPLRAGKIM